MAEEYESKIQGILENQSLSNRLRDEKHEQNLKDQEDLMLKELEKMRDEMSRRA